MKIMKTWTLPVLTVTQIHLAENHNTTRKIDAQSMHLTSN